VWCRALAAGMAECGTEPSRSRLVRGAGALRQGPQPALAAQPIELMVQIL
jgi:hypothetical protein